MRLVQFHLCPGCGRSPNRAAVIDRQILTIQHLRPYKQPRSETTASRMDQDKAADGIRTHDLILTKDALYQLSYSSNRIDRPLKHGPSNLNGALPAGTHGIVAPPATASPTTA